MNAPPADARLHALTFGDLQTGIWGVMLAGAGAPDAALVVGGEQVGERTVVVSAEGFPSAEGKPSAEPWRLQGEGAELSAALPGEGDVPQNGGGAPPEAEAWAQRCHVEGAVRLNQAEVPLSCEGIRATHPAPGRSFDSARVVCAWVDSGPGVALAAVRPQHARGHDRDRILACSLDLSGSRAASDPRLSITFAADNTPSRAGVELWLTSEDGESEYPRRGSGITIGRPLALSAAGLHGACHPLRWTSQGQTGTGLFLLIRPVDVEVRKPAGRRARP